MCSNRWLCQDSESICLKSSLLDCFSQGNKQLSTASQAVSNILSGETAFRQDEDNVESFSSSGSVMRLPVSTPGLVQQLLLFIQFFSSVRTGRFIDIITKQSFFQMCLGQYWKFANYVSTLLPLEKGSKTNKILRGMNQLDDFISFTEIWWTRNVGIICCACHLGMQVSLTHSFFQISITRWSIGRLVDKAWDSLCTNDSGITQVQWKSYAASGNPECTTKTSTYCSPLSLICWHSRSECHCHPILQ